MEKLIFLDIDGVLATTKQFQTNTTKFREKYEIAAKLKIPYPFDRGCVKILNEIQEETDAETILSSDWRLYFTLPDIEEIFKFNGVLKSPMWFTPKLSSFSNDLECTRVREILSFVKKYEPKKWVALDDMHLAQCSKLELSDKFILIRDTEGLKQTGMKNKIINKLNGF